MYFIPITSLIYLIGELPEESKNQLKPALEDLLAGLDMTNHNAEFVVDGIRKAMDN